VAAELGITFAELRHDLYKIGRWKTVVLPELLDDPVFAQDDTAAGRSRLNGTEVETTPEDQGRLRASVAAALVSLSTPAQAMFALYHAAHLTLHEIGHVIGLADGNVPIYFGDAVVRLRGQVPELAEQADRMSLAAAIGQPPVTHLWCGADDIDHVVLGQAPFLMMLCTGRAPHPISPMHSTDGCPRGSRLCRTCRAYRDFGRDCGAPWPLAQSDETSVDAFKALPAAEKLVILLRYYEALEGFPTSLAQIAELLGVSETTVRSLHTKAIQRIRDP
jgi:DNA-directed RNA polymerase specialized sigma24 family protein